MAGRKRFGTAFMGGFNKSDVNVYVENMINEYNAKARERDAEIASLRTKCQDLEAKLAETKAKYDEIESERLNIANTLIQAQANAGKILEDAKSRYHEEIKEYDKMLEAEKEKLVEMKQQIRAFRSQAVETIKKLEESLPVAED